MSTAFGIVNVITEAKYIFMEFIYILESTFYRNAFWFPFEINYIMKCFTLFIDIFYKSNDTVRFMEL